MLLLFEEKKGKVRKNANWEYGLFESALSAAGIEEGRKGN